MTTRAQTDPWYEALENAIETLPAMKSGVAVRDSMIFGVSLSEPKLKEWINEVDPSGKSLQAIMAVEILPTRFDDPLNFRLMSLLMAGVRSSAGTFPIESSTYGGFCFAPTGEVMARAVPIRPAGGTMQSRVFIVFDSGLFVFIDGVVRTIVGTAPADFLQGGTMHEWMAAWDRDRGSSERLEASRALASWLQYMQHPDIRDDLSYVPMSGFGPNGLKLVGDMVYGAEVFIAAHEFVHAAKSHHLILEKSNIEIELEADYIGAKIAVRAFFINNVNHRYALSGICIFLKCVDRLAKGDISHPSYKLRLSAVMTAFAKSGCLDESVSSLVKTFAQCFDDLCAQEDKI